MWPCIEQTNSTVKMAINTSEEDSRPVGQSGELEQGRVSGPVSTKKVVYLSLLGSPGACPLRQ